MLRALRRVLLAAAILLAAIVVGGAMDLFAGKRPDSLGVQDGRLAPCKPTPNCVSSQADRSDTTHYVTPLPAGDDPARAFATLKRIVRETPRVKVVRDDAGYLYAEYRSRLFQFVDDVEFWLDARAGVIHVRSASRLGQGDLGVNRKRIEDIRARLAAAR